MNSIQLQTLKNAIVSDATMDAFPNTPDGNAALADYLNTTASPAVMLWRKDLPASEVVAAVIGSEFTALTVQKQAGLTLLLSPGVVDATSDNVRADFQAIFSSGTSLTNLTTVAKRAGTRLETIAGFLTSGVQGANTSSVYGVTVSGSDVAQARNLP